MIKYPLQYDYSNNVLIDANGNTLNGYQTMEVLLRAVEILNQAELFKLG